MAKTWWTGNAQQIQQVDTLQVTAVAVGGTLTAAINGKLITYTCVVGDTITSATSAWFALLNNSQSSPPEFQQQTWANPSPGFITATATVPGTPFTMTAAGAGGATLTLTHTTANSSQSDIGNPANWLRAGAVGVPQVGDDVIIANSNIPLLWNLDHYAAVRFNSLRRYQSFTATIGLPDWNPLGYLEYRPTYMKFLGPNAAVMTIILGEGAGAGPSRERYDTQNQAIDLTLLASGSPQDDYAVRLLNTFVDGALIWVSTSSLGVAVWPGEVSTVDAVTVDGGGVCDLGSGVTITEGVILNAASSTIWCNAIGIAFQASNGSQLTLAGPGMTYGTVTAEDSSVITWPIEGTITTLSMVRNSVLDKSGDTRNITSYNSTIVNSTIDGTCVINDPNSCLAYTNATTVKGVVASGPFIFGPGSGVSRTVKIT